MIRHEKTSFIRLNKNRRCKPGMSWVSRTQREVHRLVRERTHVQRHAAAWSSLLPALPHFQLKSSGTQTKLPPFHIFAFLPQPTPPTPAQSNLCLHVTMTVIHCREHLAINHIRPSVMSSIFFNCCLNCSLNLTLVYLTFPAEKAMEKPTHLGVHTEASSGKTR